MANGYYEEMQARVTKAVRTLCIDFEVTQIWHVLPAVMPIALYIAQHTNAPAMHKTHYPEQVALQLVRRAMEELGYEFTTSS
jgi:hypothetical protein